MKHRILIVVASSVLLMLSVIGATSLAHSQEQQLKEGQHLSSRGIQNSFGTVITPPSTNTSFVGCTATGPIGTPSPGVSCKGIAATGTPSTGTGTPQATATSTPGVVCTGTPRPTAPATGTATPRPTAPAIGTATPRPTGTATGTGTPQATSIPTTGTGALGCLGTSSTTRTGFAGA